MAVLFPFKVGAKVASFLFLAENRLFWPFFEIWTSTLFCQSFSLINLPLSWPGLCVLYTLSSPWAAWIRRGTAKLCSAPYARPDCWSSNKGTKHSWSFLTNNDRVIRNVEVEKTTLSDYYPVKVNLKYNIRILLNPPNPSVRILFDNVESKHIN